MAEQNMTESVCYSAGRHRRLRGTEKIQNHRRDKTEDGIVFCELEI